MIGARVVVRQVIRIGGDKEKGREMVLVRLENEEQRWEVLGKKMLLKGRRERIMEDLTWEERRLRWRLEEFARVEEKKGKRVWVENRRVKIDGYWWRWDEKEEVLKDGRGNMRGIERGEGKEEEKGVIK